MTAITAEDRYNYIIRTLGADFIGSQIVKLKERCEQQGMNKYGSIMTIVCIDYELNHGLTILDNSTKIEAYIYITKCILGEID